MKKDVPGALLSALISAIVMLACPAAPPPADEAAFVGETPSRGEEITSPRAAIRTIVPGETISANSTDQAELSIPLPEGKAILPYDFHIGNLEAADPAYAGAETQARAWLAAFLAGKATEDLQTQDMTSIALDAKRELANASFTAFRIAAPLPLEDGSLSFLVRMRGDILVLNAELILVREQEQWLVGDLVLDGLPLDKADEPVFDPFSYSRFSQE